MPKNSDDSSRLTERQFQALVKQLDVLVRTAESAASDQKLMAYVVHLFFSQRAVGIAECFLRGSHLNDLLLREKHALLVV